MKSYTEIQHKELVSKLELMDEQYDPQNLMDPRLKIITEVIDKIKVKLKTHRFSCAEDEVYYFKFVLPPTLALYMYYADKIEWDRIFRQGSPECRYRFHDRIYSQAENFRAEYNVFCVYVRDGREELDEMYFLRSSPMNRQESDSMNRIIDPSSPPKHCGILATWMAHTKMELELKKSLEDKKEELPNIKPVKSKLRWTGKQIDLIELVYGLKESGALNDGKASLKDIFDFCKETLSFDPGNTSRLFQDILGRHAGYTTFLDSMKVKLHKRIENIEKENIK